MKEHIVAAEDNEIRLDRWFKRHFALITHGHLEKMLRKGDVKLNGKKAKASDRLVEGNVITMREQAEGIDPGRQSAPRKSESVKPKAEDIEMLRASVLYKDEDVIVINKPPGLAVQGGTKVSKSVDSMLDSLRFDAKERPKLVHRLDRDTSGVLVLARSAKAATRLMKAFTSKEAEKTYWALIKGVPDIFQGKIDLPLAKQEDGDVEKVSIDKENGKKAVTFYRVIDKLSNKIAWVELMPITGRTHQLRVHMAAIGYPILCDGKYGGRESFVDGMEISRKLHLHARRLVIPGMLDVTAELPKHMQDSWDSLGLSIEE